MIIYLSTNAVNGKCYVGQTVQSLKDRVRGHRGSSKKSDSPLYRAMRKYGFESFTFEVLEECHDDFDLDMSERFWIECYDSLAPNGYNLESGGNINKRVSDETKAKIRIALIGRVKSDEERARISAGKIGKKRPPVSDETRAKISAANKGRVKSNETRAKLRAASTGRVKSPEERAKISAATRSKKKKPRSPEHCEKIRAAKLGVKRSEETRAKISAANRARTHRKSLPFEVNLMSE